MTITGVISANEELTPRMDESNREAAATLRVSAVEATDRLRRAVGMLREDAAPVGEPVAALVERAAEAGMNVKLVEQAVHRVVQEALTNAARHAPGAEVVVLVERTSGTVRVEVTDTGTSAPGSGASGPETSRSGGGLAEPGSGLAGLAERTRLLGGTFSAGPRGSGFAVVVELPTTSAG